MNNSASTRQNRILVVDDDANLRWVLQTQLEDAGYEVATAGDGQAALAFVQHTRPALVLTDLKMPGMSGLELLKQIRTEEPDLPVIVITAFGSIQNAVEAVKAGAYDYLTKPIDYDDLALGIRRALEQGVLQHGLHAARLVRGDVSEISGVPVFRLGGRIAVDRPMRIEVRARRRRIRSAAVAELVKMDAMTAWCEASEHHVDRESLVGLREADRASRAVAGGRCRRTRGTEARRPAD